MDAIIVTFVIFLSPVVQLAELSDCLLICVKMFFVRNSRYKRYFTLLFSLCSAVKLS